MCVCGVHLDEVRGQCSMEVRPKPPLASHSMPTCRKERSAHSTMSHTRRDPCKDAKACLLQRCIHLSDVRAKACAMPPIAPSVAHISS